MENWNIQIVSPGYKFDRDIYIFRKLPGGQTQIMQQDGSMKVYEPGSAVPQSPSFSLSPEVLQAFSDTLNSHGFKPQKGFIEGKLEATERHLGDMRTLLKFKK